MHSILNQDDHQMIRSSSSVFITAPLHCSATGHITPCMPSFWELVILGWVETCLQLKHYICMWVCTYIFTRYLERVWSPVLGSEDNRWLQNPPKGMDMEVHPLIVWLVLELTKRDLYILYIYIYIYIYIIAVWILQLVCMYYWIRQIH